MPLQALGPLTTNPGTKVPVSSLIPAVQWAPGQGPFKGHGVLFQALENNSGKVYVYQLQGATYTLAAVLAPPTANFIASFSVALTISPNSIRIDDLYLDVETPGEGALVDILVA